MCEESHSRWTGGGLVGVAWETGERNTDFGCRLGASGRCDGSLRVGGPWLRLLEGGMDGMSTGRDDGRGKEEYKWLIGGE
jgi:hypothetical protein